MQALLWLCTTDSFDFLVILPWYLYNRRSFRKPVTSIFTGFQGEEKVDLQDASWVLAGY